MAKHGVALCPTLAAAEAMSKYRGWQPGTEPEPKSAQVAARRRFKEALDAGVTIVCGSDAGVFAHGDNARELELMVDYGMTPAAGAACGHLGRRQGAAPRRPSAACEPGLLADLVAVEGDPTQDDRGAAEGAVGDEGRHGGVGGKARIAMICTAPKPSGRVFVSGQWLRLRSIPVDERAGRPARHCGLGR